MGYSGLVAKDTRMTRPPTDWRLISLDGVNLQKDLITEVVYAEDTGNRANCMSSTRISGRRHDCARELLIARSLRIIGTSEKFPRTPDTHAVCAPLPVKSFVCRFRNRRAVESAVRLGKSLYREESSTTGARARASMSFSRSWRMLLLLLSVVAIRHYSSRDRQMR